MTTDLDAAFKNVQEAVNAGQPDKARERLQAVARNYPRDERVWLWLAALSKTPQESLDYITQAELLAPNDERVKKAKAWANSQLVNQTEGGASVAESPPPKEIPTSSVSKFKAKQPVPRADPRVFRYAVIFMIIVLLLVITFIVFKFTRDTRSERQEHTPIAYEALSETTIHTASGPALLEVSTETPTNEPTQTPTPSPVLSDVEPTEIPRRANMIRPKNILSSLAEVPPTWTPTPRPTDTLTPSPTPFPTFVSDPADTTVYLPLGLTVSEKWIDVNITSQTLVAFEGNIPVFDSLVSTGTDLHPTVTGQFRIWLRLSSQDMDGYRLGYDYFLRNVPFVQYFYYDYSLHGTFWHSNFGRPMSHGCVNLPTPAAEWLFNWAEYGTLVNIHI
ncbi:MAG: L,D-transpeptidase family protein [Candidatus Promineifilaceae bacterium]